LAHRGCWANARYVRPIGKVRVNFEAPGVDRLEKEMQTFFDCFANGHNIDPVLKSGIAHL